MALSTTVATGDPDHAGLHNEERGQINNNEVAAAAAETHADDAVATHALVSSSVHGHPNLKLALMVITESATTQGVWDADAPVRDANGYPRVEFRGKFVDSDPTSATIGVDTPENCDPENDVLIRPTA